MKIKLKSILRLFLIIILTWSALYCMARSYESYAHDKWYRTFGDPIENLAKDFPARSDNASAIRLKQLAIRLGIVFTTQGDTDKYSPKSKDAHRLRLVGGFDGRLSSYIQTEIENPKISIDPPRKIVSSYLKDYQKQLEAVRDHILSSPPILWRQDLNHWAKPKQPDNVLPKLTEILELQRTMAACALDLGSRNNFYEAEAYIDAGWKLNQALREHPAIPSQLIGLVIDRQWLGVIRKLPVNLAWNRKIADHNYRKSLMKAFQADAWQLWRRHDAPLPGIPILNVIMEPYTRICVASALEKELQEIKSLQSLNSRSLHLEDFDEITESSKWNLIQPERWPNQKEEIYGRVTRLEIDREFTAMFIRANHGLLPGENNEWRTFQVFRTVQQRL
jgi:hypothetical protein